MVNAQLGTVLRHLGSLAASRGTEDLSDTELLQRFCAGREETAFAALMQRHGGMVWGVCRDLLRHEHDAEDAFQATFLVLARQAGSIRKSEAVASWLHGTARRIALAARRTAVSRASHERRERSMPQKSLSDETLREALGMLDAEVQRLSERQRAVFVLCHLEGKTRAEAARLLGWKEGTVTGTLSRARERLRQRLVLRGVTLSSALCAAVLARQAAAAPAVLVKSTFRAALSYAAGNEGTATVSTAVAALIQGVTKTMKTTFKTATILLLALAAATAGVGALAYSKASARPPETPAAQSRPPQDKTPTRPAEAEEVGTLAVHGRVLDPSGKPVEAVKVYLVDDLKKKTTLKVHAASGADGRFRFSVPVAQVNLGHYTDHRWDHVYVLAAAEGFGPALEAIHDPAAAGERTLRLVPDDVPIKGRILNLEGKPVAGARVRIDHLSVPKTSDLTTWLEDLKGSKDGYPTENRHLTTLWGGALSSLVPEVTADGDGRFQIRGIGRERIVGLTISGPTIETRQVRVRTRPGETMQRLEWADFPRSGTLTYYGASFEHLAGPTQVIVGVVRDKDTGKPLSGIRVQSEKLANNDLHGRDFIHTTTDKDGHYRLVGMPRGEGNLIKAQAVNDQPYWASVAGVPHNLGVEEATVDFQLGRGVLIKGRVTDKLTGKPISAEVEYFVFQDNPHLKNAPNAALRQRDHTDADGSFQFIGLPGRSLVAARASGDHYAVGVGAEKYKDRDPLGHLQQVPGCLAIAYHTLVEVEPAKDADGIHCEVVLDPGRTLHGIILGPDGKPLAGALACGVKSYAYTYWEGEPLKTAEFAAFGFKDGRPRNLLVLHQEKKLAGSLLLHGDEKEPLSIRLEPWATIAGRLLTPDGLPDTDGELRFLMGSRFDDVTVGSHPTRGFRPDKEGRFRIDGLVPGLKYNLGIVKKGRIVGYVFQDATFKSAETRDLGDVKPGE
jgi:RNA polymerase sigma factor (sigma-70 family)